MTALAPANVSLPKSFRRLKIGSPADQRKIPPERGVVRRSPRPATGLWRISGKHATLRVGSGALSDVPLGDIARQIEEGRFKAKPSRVFDFEDIREAHAANYPNAELLIHENEVAHWNDDAAMRAAPERKRTRYFEAARRQLRPYMKQLRTFTKGDVFPGVTAVPIPGHTPGHTGYRIGEGDDHVFVWGDTVQIPEIQTRRPDVTLDFDSDPDASAAMRRKILEMATVDGLLIAGMHVHFPGFSHVVRDGDGYRLEPEAWSPVV
jgi:hypothetical protein